MAIIGPSGSRQRHGWSSVLAAEAGTPMLAPVGTAAAVHHMTAQKEMGPSKHTNDDLIAEALVEQMKSNWASKPLVS